MKTPADTWFFESLAHGFPDSLTIVLAEGIKSADAQMVEVAEGKRIGPFHTVSVTAESRVLRIRFSDVLAYQVVDESFSAPQSGVEGDLLDDVVHRCTSSAYQRYVETDSLLEKLREGRYNTYFVWTEDQTVFVIAPKDPRIEMTEGGADLSLPRGGTYSRAYDAT